MENMEKGLTVPKWVLIFRPKIPQMLQNLSAQFFCTSPKVLDFNEKRLHWSSVVRAPSERNSPQCTLGCFPFFFRLRLPVGSADKCSIGQLICSMHFLHVKHRKFRWIKLSFSSCLTQWPILSKLVQKLAKFPSIAFRAF